MRSAIAAPCLFLAVASGSANAAPITVSFNACGDRWAYTIVAAGSEVFSTSLQNGGNDISINVSPATSSPSLSGHMSGSTGTFDLNLPFADLGGLQQLIVPHRLYYVSVSFHAASGGNPDDLVLEHFNVHDTNKANPNCPL